ncbi:hypothetical protein BBC0244_022950 [Bartonella apihabitans]|uniref:hypothetical protein n=1 Tax=Bartonella apihabitans TaxID=2750929 RepID=UPI00098EE16E|nr:hypothetical protein [Bartonella apihabitans]AQT44816.1 hypothetical protein BBC0244_011090 [Bartonella apihabitans]AQT45947.1 hypothetical protein BBC0244_022950 [Bartonella apihabitans]
MNKRFVAAVTFGVTTLLVSPVMAQDCQLMVKVLQKLKTKRQNALVKFCQEEACTYYFKNPQADKKKPYIELQANHDAMGEDQCVFEIRTISAVEFKRIEKNFKAGAYEIGDDEAGDYDGE